jgi:predicted nucleic acid-binding Zn ribbon protein
MSKINKITHTFSRCKNCKKLYQYLIDSEHEEFCSDKCQREFNRQKNMSIIRPIKK